MQNTCVNSYLVVAAQGLGVSSDWHDYIAMVILLSIITLGILICVFRRHFARIFGPALTNVACPAQQKKVLLRSDASHGDQEKKNSTPTVAYKSVSTTEAHAKAVEIGMIGTDSGAAVGALNFEQKPESVIYVHGVITCVCNKSLPLEVRMDPGWFGGSPTATCPDCGTRIAILDQISGKTAIIVASIEAVKRQYQSLNISLNLVGFSEKQDAQPAADQSNKMSQQIPEGNRSVSKPAWLDQRSIIKPQSIAYDFAKAELGKEKPDFKSFQKVLNRFSEGWEINNGWTVLVLECNKKNRPWFANQCAIEGLSHFCEKGVTTWDMITVCADVQKAEQLQELAHGFSYNGEQQTMVKVLACLKKIYGEPGDTQKTKEELQRIEIDL